MHFVCPKCGSSLVISDTGTAVCERRHSYDKSRYGYYNLLLGGGGTHGDNRDMIIARRDFLECGFYLPLAERISALAALHTPASGVLLDIGCGEGYYTGKIKEAIGGRVSVCAFDISKDAVREAAKRHAADEYAVASAYRMPIADLSVDTAVNIFSPLAIDELCRTVKPHGKFIMAIPGEEHLFELKAAIYDTPYKNEVADTALRGFTLIGCEELCYDMRLDTKEKIHSLFMMTPYAYRTSAVGRERAAALDLLTVKAHFMILVYERKEEG